MPIVIRKDGEFYMAEVTPPHGQGVAWSTPQPMSRDELIEALRERGCHQADIGDAFYEADPHWLSSD
jgi:hypothetical protein